MKLIKNTLYVLTLLSINSIVSAQDTDLYPSRPIRMIVPFAPGGGADMTARVISDELSKKTGQPVIVENKPGAGATVGASYVARSAPDGYTILYTTPGPQITNPYLMKSLPYKVSDLKPISKVSFVPSVLVINNNLPVKSIKELIEYAKNNPNKVRYASAGVGASSHLNGELLQTMANIKLVHIPYKGTGDALKDLVGGNTDMAIDTLAVYLPFIQTGRLIPLGVTTPNKIELLPEIDPIALNLPGYDSSPMNYLSVPADTPSEITTYLNKVVNETLQEPHVKEQLLKQGIIAEGSTIEEIEVQIKKEQERWLKVIDDAGLKPQ